MTLDDVLAHREIARLATVLRGRVAANLDAAPPDEAVLHAAVALVLRPGADSGIELLLIKRAEFEGDPWSGHVALPGGRREAADLTLEQTAVRETREETGIDIGRDGRILGALDEIAPTNPTRRRVVVRPYVAAVRPGVALVASEEVADAFWVPLSALRTTAAWTDTEVSAHGRQLNVTAFAHGDYIVWGLTERIIRRFLDFASPDPEGRR